MPGVICANESSDAMEARRHETSRTNQNLILGRSRGRPLTLEDVYRLVLDLGDQLDRIEKRLHEQAQSRQSAERKDTPDVNHV